MSFFFQLKNEMSTIIDDLIVNYNQGENGNHNNAEITWDYIQYSLKCCGWKSYQNWTKNPNVSNQTDIFPCSCVMNTNNTYGFCNANTSSLHQEVSDPRGETYQACRPYNCTRAVRDWGPFYTRCGINEFLGPLPWSHRSGCGLLLSRCQLIYWETPRKHCD
ncbi:hypothetical protein AB205_0174840 [Aquarana catesbeiana]|uniref:Uncharacterized protein n=1 Tax=Aquarana catesbeiana TaxID=8400 RepID=A0A2G9R5V1_AQUCT|nr:hypothetical protein AB205_0174840 [Aquarana catesbeiana]